MAGRIYHLNDKSKLVSLEEAPYDSEKLLQELLANHPDLLAGEQINSDEPRRWLLVAREISVQADHDGAARWSLDHLFLDQDAIPTLVEVKRSSNAGIRRAVVGQLLDYAANAVVHWPVEEVRAKFERSCEQSGKDSQEVLAAFLEEDGEPDDFWLLAKTNLQAGRIRLVFVADVIPPELRRVVEFLNQQMDPAEVLALEVKQYVGDGFKTLVPRLVGQTETARQKKSPGAGSSRAWNEASFMERVGKLHGDGQQAAAQDFLHWIQPLVTDLWWGRGAKEGGVVPIVRSGSQKVHVCRIATGGRVGRVVFRFDWYRKKPQLSDEVLRRTLLGKINEIPGVQFDDTAINRPVRIPLATLSNPAATEKLKAAMLWLIGSINKPT